MARHLTASLGAMTPAHAGVLSALGFLAACAAIMIAMAMQLPVTGPEAAYHGRLIHGPSPDAPAGQITDLVLQLGLMSWPDTLNGRFPFIAATLIGGLLQLHLSRAISAGPVAGNMALAWTFTSVLILIGGGLVGPGPLGLLFMTGFATTLTRLLAHETTLRWFTTWLFSVLLIATLPEMLPVAVAILAAPILVRQCRIWLLRPWFWAIPGTAGLLLMTSAGMNDVHPLWPLARLQLPAGTDLVVLSLATVPLLLAAAIACLTAGLGRAPINPARSLCWLLALGSILAILATGLKPSLLIACLPLLTVLGADVTLSSGRPVAAWLVDHALAFSVAVLITGLVLWASSANVLFQRVPSLKQSVGWTSLAMQVEALGVQNDVKWVAVDRYRDAKFLADTLPSATTIVVLGARNPIKADCASNGIYVSHDATKAPRVEFRSYRTLMNVTRVFRNSAVGTHGLAIVSQPLDPSFCRVS